jgi:hypothetical protein
VKIPARADLLAAFAAALADADPTDPAAAIRAAVEVVLPEPPHGGRCHPVTMRHRAQLLALADAVQPWPAEGAAEKPLIGA